MKELKFKVWDTVRGKIFKPQGITFDTNSLAPFAVKVSGRSWEPAGKFELIEWTGLIDNGGTDIYEGDFIKLGAIIYNVTWNTKEACFELLESDSASKRSITDAISGEVVGNKFQDTGLHMI